KTVVLTYTEIIWIFFVRTPILKKHCLILIDISSDNLAAAWVVAWLSDALLIEIYTTASGDYNR
ncbi:MAG: hypothetical protein WA395_10135, partial [Nitrososphaeraceae archaeon]